MESQGTTDSRSGHATYGQELEGYVRCPSGEFGAKSSMQQAWVQCRQNAGSSVTLNYCEPTNSNDTAYSDCSNGEEYTTNANVGGVASSFVGSSAKIAIENCTNDDFDYFCGGGNAYKVILSRSGSFSGGEGQANAQGNDRLNDPNGPVANTQGSGVYDQDGKPMLSGTNPNSGTAAAEMISASQTSQCAKDVGVSLDQGEPVFTCGSDEEVGTFTSGEDGGCEETERCTAWEDEQITRTEECTQSTDLSQPECRVQYPVRQCQRARIGGTETCEESTSVDVKVRLERKLEGWDRDKAYSNTGLGEKTNYWGIPAIAITRRTGLFSVPEVPIARAILAGLPRPASISDSLEEVSNFKVSVNSKLITKGDLYYENWFGNIAVSSSELPYVSPGYSYHIFDSDRETSCPEGFNRESGTSTCVNNVDLSGYHRFKTKKPSGSQYTYAYYKKESTSNSCGQYE